MSTATSPKRRAARLAIASNSFLIAIKLAAGLLTGSVGIISDAVHSLMDLVASVISLLSVRKGEDPPDSTHRYGHEGLEDLSAGAQAILLLAGAAFVIFESIHRLIVGGNVDSAGLGMVVVGVAAAINVVVSTLLRRTGRESNSPALTATATDLRTDAIVSLGVLVTLIAIKLTGLSWLDPAVGLVIGLAISSTGVRILMAAGRRLAGETIAPDELERLHDVARSFIGPEVLGYHDLRARHIGSSHQVDLHVQFAEGTSLRRAHELSHKLQDAMTARLPGTTVLIHLEPQDRVRADRFDDAGDGHDAHLGSTPESARSGSSLGHPEHRDR
jgi:cation diffusion facilitator family transporter